uniref:Uncharacterized protein n=1 Tax=Avena sativa TaxID=4498 RepID=A0ACD5WXF0_AVESA
MTSMHNTPLIKAISITRTVFQLRSSILFPIISLGLTASSRSAMKAHRDLLLVTVATVTLLGTALGTSYTVGAPDGSWDLKTNSIQWASGVRFYAGDQLLFQYSVSEHNVVEVTKSGYDTCNGSNNTVVTYQTGNDAVPLAAAGTRYFICGIPGHCAAGMKLQVNVSSPAVSSPPQQQCRWKGGKRRCNWSVSPSSSASAAVRADQSAVLWLRLAAVLAAGLVLLC